MLTPLADYMQENKITLEDLARKTGLHFSYLSLIKNGYRVPSAKTARLISWACDRKVTEMQILYLDPEVVLTSKEE